MDRWQVKSLPEPLSAQPAAKPAERALSNSAVAAPTPSLGNSSFDTLPFAELFAPIDEDLRLDTVPGMSMRSINALHRNGARRFRDTHYWTPQSLARMWNVGAVTVDEILAALHVAADGARTLSAQHELELGPSAEWPESGAHDTEHAHRSTDHAAIRAAWETNRALRTIAGWASAHLSPELAVTTALIEVPKQASLPAYVFEALESLATVKVGALVPEADRATAQQELHDWIVVLDTRENAVLRNRILATEPLTLMTLAELTGVSRERVRQIEQAVRLKAQNLFTPSWKALASDLALVKATVGDFNLLAAAPKLELNIRTLIPEIKLTPVEILMRLSGAGETAEGFIAFPDLSTWRRRTQPVIEEALADRVNELDEFVGRLGTIGIPAGAATEWLSTFDVAVATDVVAARPRTLGDRAALALTEANEPMTLAQINQRFGGGFNEASIRNALVADERLLRVGPKTWALREWEMDEFISLRDAMHGTLRANDDRMLLKELAAEMHQRFGVSKASVRVYAGQEPFELDDGIIGIA